MEWIANKPNPIATRFRALFGAAWLLVRAAIRSRVVIALSLLLAAGMVGIPHLVTGDGTPSGEMQIRLRYTLAFGFAILGLASLWTACATFAAEIDSRRFELTAVKPAPPWVLWLGRWVGILFLNGILLLAIVAVAWFQVRRGLPDRADRDRLLVSRALARPNLPPPETEARRTIEELRLAGRLPKNASDSTLLRRIAREVGNRYTLVHPGEQTAWRFHLDRPVGEDGRLWLRMRFDSDAGMRPEVRGLCRLTRMDGVPGSCDVAIDNPAQNPLELPLSAPGLSGAREVELTFIYPNAPRAAGLLIQPRRNLAILTPSGSFAGNLLRVVAAQWALLAALAAIGLTLGACFSFPVAAFVATTLLAAMVVSDDALRDDPLAEFDAGGPPRLTRLASEAVVRGVCAVTRPLLAPDPLAQAVAGEQVPGRTLRGMLLWGGLIDPLVLLLLADCALRRRELCR
jgi:hypothetical protein